MTKFTIPLMILSILGITLVLLGLSVMVYESRNRPTVQTFNIVCVSDDGHLLGVTAATKVGSDTWDIGRPRTLTKGYLNGTLTINWSPDR